MTFSHPWLLVAGPVVVVLVVLGLVRFTARHRRLADFLGGRRATERLGRPHLRRIPAGRTTLLGLAALCLAVAAAGPRWGAVPAPPAPEPPPPDVVLAIDISASMQAEDVTPTRLARATEIARELLATLEHGRVGLALFSGTPYTLAPPTEDHQALRYLLDGITPDLVNIYDPGSLPSALLREATARLAPEDSAGRAATVASEEVASNPLGPRVLVVIGDGEAGEATASIRDAATSTAEAGVRIHTIGVGTAEGGRMVLPAGYTRKGVYGSGPPAPMVSRLEEGTLREMAEIGGGLYAHAEDAAALARIHRTLGEPVAEAPPEAEGPLWARIGPGALLIGLALLALLAESLLGPGILRAPTPTRRVRRAS